MHLVMFLNTLPLAGGTVADVIDNLASSIGYHHNGENTSLALKDEISGKLTINMGVLKIDGDNVECMLDIRYPVTFEKRRHHGEGGTYLWIRIRYYCFTTTFRRYMAPEDSPLIIKLKEAYSEITGEEAYCMAMGGATYARAFENACILRTAFPGRRAC